MVPIARHSLCALKKKVGITDVEIRCGQITLHVRTVMMTSSNRSNAVPDLLSSTTLQNMHCKAGIFPSIFVCCRGFFEKSVFFKDRNIFSGRILAQAYIPDSAMRIVNMLNACIFSYVPKTLKLINYDNTSWIVVS